MTLFYIKKGIINCQKYIFRQLLYNHRLNEETFDDKKLICTIYRVTLHNCKIEPCCSLKKKWFIIAIAASI